ncbi:unnamed protein product [Trichobilharzia regenti]|nr:unnamed protein product [Trichobilharzia regenti]
MEKRHDRQGNENIKDAPYIGLLEEVSALRDSIDVLEEKLAKSRYVFTLFFQKKLFYPIFLYYLF